MTNGIGIHSRDYERVARAVRYIAGSAADQPGLAEVAAHLEMSPYHLQRLFRRWAGVSPKRFLQCLTVEHAKALLADSVSVLDAALEVGLSGPARLHDHFVALEAVTPGEYKSAGDGLTIRWGVAETPFGAAFLARTDRGICRLAFPAAGELAGERELLAARWPEASLVEDGVAARRCARRVFAARTPAEPLHLAVRGTNFQVAVWRALLAIPPGCLVTYGELARALERPRSARAVGAAVGANPIAYLIPCHRVVRQAGALGGYRWGTTRKRALIAWESSRRGGGEPAVAQAAAG